jgi:hypothetical protein
MDFGKVRVWGRHSGPLGELACLADIDPTAGYREQVYPGGWHTGALGTSEYPDLQWLAVQLVEATGAPAVAMYLADTGFADGACNSPNRTRCSFYLNEQTFIDQVADEWNPGDLAGITLCRNQAALPILHAWATEAGLTPDRQALETALARSPDDDGLAAFTRALGIPTAPPR